ncbi:hypothetical protein RGC37_05720, partial [Helicobacter pylori]|nr:hypothetical protein [Helicobacter pylori]
HSTIQPFNHSTIQPFNHSSNQAIKHSSIQAFKQRYYTFIAFTKDCLKIPYSLLFPLALTRTTFLNHLIP